MIQGPGGNRKWDQRSSVGGGPHTDFSNMGQCKGECQSLQMHVMVLNFESFLNSVNSADLDKRNE